MQTRSFRILLVEDSLPDALLVTRQLEAELGSLEQIEIERATSLEQAIHELAAKPSDVVLLDLNLPDSAGTETVYRLREAEPWVPVVVYASAGEIGLPLRALQAGAQDFLSKGDFECGSVTDRIRSAIERTRLFRETQRRQDELAIAERMQSLGVLGTGAAIELDERIGAVLDHTDAAIAELAAAPQLARTQLHLAETRTAALRAIELAAHLREYAHPDGSSGAPGLHLAELVRAARPRLEGIVGTGIELDCAFAEPDPPVSVGPVELRQVLFNLVIHARESIRPGPGRISISTGEIWADAKRLAAGRGAASLREGRYAALCVSDSGHALDAESAARLLDPRPGAPVPGRAIGLAPALGAVRRHGGWIGADGDPTRPGARFQVLFPAAY